MVKKTPVVVTPAVPAQRVAALGKNFEGLAGPMVQTARPMAAPASAIPVTGVSAGTAPPVMVKGQLDPYRYMKNRSR